MWVLHLKNHLEFEGHGQGHRKGKLLFETFLSRMRNLLICKTIMTLTEYTQQNATQPVVKGD